MKSSDSCVPIQVKVDPELKERFQAFVFEKTGDRKGMARVIRSLMLREITKWEEAQREAKRREEEHQAKLAALGRKGKTQ